MMKDKKYRRGLKKEKIVTPPEYEEYDTELSGDNQGEAYYDDLSYEDNSKENMEEEVEGNIDDGASDDREIEDISEDKESSDQSVFTKLLWNSFLKKTKGV